MLWGKDAQGRYLFIYEIEHEVNVDDKKLPKLDGIMLTVIKQFEVIAEQVNEVILNPPEGITSNSSEWAKKLKCWETVQGLRITLSESLIHLLINPEEKKEIEHDARRKQNMQNGIHDQTYVVEKTAGYWYKLREWNRLYNILSPMETSILNVACSIPNKIPSDKQSKILIEAEKKALQEGFFVD